MSMIIIICLVVLSSLMTALMLYNARRADEWRERTNAEIDARVGLVFERDNLLREMSIYKMYESNRGVDAEVPRDPIVEAVRLDLLRRSQEGIKKYGTTLAGNDAPLRDRIQHFYEEMLDGANYAKWIMTLIDEGIVLPSGGTPQGEQFVDWAQRTGRKVEPEFAKTFDRIAPDEVQPEVPFRTRMRDDGTMSDMPDEVQAERRFDETPRMEKP